MPFCNTFLLRRQPQPLDNNSGYGPVSLLKPSFWCQINCGWHDKTRAVFEVQLTGEYCETLRCNRQRKTVCCVEDTVLHRDRVFSNYLFHACFREQKRFQSREIIKQLNHVVMCLLSANTCNTKLSGDTALCWIWVLLWTIADRQHVMQDLQQLFQFTEHTDYTPGQKISWNPSIRPPIGLMF